MIAGGDETSPVNNRYRINRAVWRMIADMVQPLGVHIYMVVSNPNIDKVQLLAEERVLVTPGKDSVIPGILHATIDGLKYVYAKNLPGSKAPYILRTNLSSFWVFKAILEWLNTQPKTQFYAGKPFKWDYVVYGSGCGFFMSRDATQILLDNEHTLHVDLYDDVAIGQVLQAQKVPLVPLKWCDYYEFQHDYAIAPPKECLDSFHYRVKSGMNIPQDSHAYMMLFFYYYGPMQTLLPAKYYN